MKDLILSYLEDEESRFIFNKRIEFNETGSFDVFSEIADRYLTGIENGRYCNEKKNEIIEKVKDKSNIWIWGGGIYGKDLVGRLKRADIKIGGVIDRDCNKKNVLDIPTFTPDKVNFSEIGCLIISMCDIQSVKECIDKAVFMGINESSIILYRDYLFCIIDDKQYFDDFIKYKEGECFVDAGVLDLGTSLRFSKECIADNISDYKIYAFEPDNSSYKRCLKIKEQHPEINIELLNFGLWSSDTTISFDSGKEGCSRIIEDENADRIKVVRLDSVIDEKVTFIKMDIEGAELEALKGCQDTIRKYKPKLAICVYHKNEDIIEIPHYIKELVPEYKLYLRHYSNYDGETVLYALPY